MIQTMWQLQDAKNRLSHVINEAINDGPQIVTRRGTKTAVIISYEQFEEWTNKKPSFIEALLNAPRLLDEPLDTTIPDDTMREIEL